MFGFCTRSQYTVHWYLVPDFLYPFSIVKNKWLPSPYHMILKARVPYMVQFYDQDYSSGIVNPCSIIIKVRGLKMLFNGTSNSHVYVQNGRLKLVSFLSFATSCYWKLILIVLLLKWVWWFCCWLYVWTKIWGIYFIFYFQQWGNRRGCGI